jgi:predicted transcriptional regulator
MDEIQNLTNISAVSEDIFSVSQYLDISRLPDIFHFAGADTLPVIDKDGLIVGIVSEFDLAKVAKELSFDKNSYQSKLTVENIMTKEVWLETQGADISNLVDKLDQMHIRVIPIVDEAGFYTGKCVTRKKLINFLTKKIKPRTISGVATPIGVYLSDGLYQVGAKNIGLMLNGAIFASFFFVAEFLTSGIQNNFWASILKLFMFLVFFKIFPISQIHASEHKVINAIEKGLPLDVKTVQKQSRIHIRCGTNLLVLFFGISTIFYITNILIPKIWLLRFMISFLLLIGLFSYWKQIGFKIQQFFTTREPTDKQVEKAIKVAEELLQVSKNDPQDKNINLLTLIYTSGFLQIIISFLVFMNILSLILYNMIK